MTPAAVPPVLTPVRPPRPAWRRWLPWLGLAAAALFVLFHEKPAGQFFYPRCTFHDATGLLCPGCGGQRAAHALLHGRLGEAVRSNAAAVLGLPLLFGALAVRGWRRRRRGLPPAPPPAAWVWLALAALGVFTVLRNLPGAPARWLAP